MPKYTFSQGKVWIEDGVYRSVLKDRKQNLDSFVLILLPSSEKKPEKSTPGKEEKPHTTS